MILMILAVSPTPPMSWTSKQSCWRKMPHESPTGNNGSSKSPSPLSPA